MQEAEELLTSTAKPHTSRRRRRDKEPRVESTAAVPANGALPAAAALPADAIAPGAVPPSAEGGWAEDMEIAEGEDAAAKFKPGIKFKLTN